MQPVQVDQYVPHHGRLRLVPAVVFPFMGVAVIALSWGRGFGRLALRFFAGKLLDHPRAGRVEADRETALAGPEAIQGRHMQWPD